MRTCYTLLNKSVEKPKRWQYGQTAPYAGVDCCPGYGCRKATGIKVEKTGGIKVEKKDKVEKRKKEEEGRCRRRRCGGRSGSAAAPLELIAPKQLLGQRRVDEILVARFAADRREKVAESQFGIEWLIQGQQPLLDQPRATESDSTPAVQTCGVRTTQRLRCHLRRACGAACAARLRRTERTVRYLPAAIREKVSFPSFQSRVCTIGY